MACLQPHGLGPHAPEARPCLGDGDRQMDEERGDAVAELQLLGGGADVDRHHGAQTGRRGRLAARDQQVA
jgi:hypothetical protein